LRKPLALSNISVGGKPNPFASTSLPPTTTLAGPAASINNTPNVGVTASVINDANGARLALVSSISGVPAT